jgi:hypothetical protein
MHFLQRCWQRRWIRGIAWTFITLITLGALLTAWMNWSGARQWKATLAMLHAEGETVDFRATMNDPIPEAENYCAIPLLKDLALVVDKDVNKGEPAQKRKQLEALKISTQGKKGPHARTRPKIDGPALGMRTDLQKWADWLREEDAQPAAAGSGDAARDVLAALSKHEAIFQELAAGLNRPKAQWTPEWKTRELPHLLPSISLPQYASLIGMNQTLALRAIAAARTGDAPTAHETAQIMARLNEASMNDPFLIGLLIAASGTGTLCNLTWELCADHAGTAEEFAQLETTLARCDLQRATLHAFRCELASDVDTIQFIKSERDNSVGLLMFEISGERVGPRTFLLRAVASGFFDANSAVFADKEFHSVIQPLRDRGLLGAYQRGKAWENQLSKMMKERWTHPSYMMASIIAPATTRVIDRVIYSQTLVNQATIGCSLERYRLAHGNYPDSLDAVRLADGQPLPRDVMNGQPMGYRKTADGRYALWSVGFDGKDDGGKRVVDAKHPENTQFHDPKYVGDWVWDFPAD